MSLTIEAVSRLLDTKLNAKLGNIGKGDEDGLGVMLKKMDDKLNLITNNLHEQSETVKKHTNLLNDYEKRIIELESMLDDQINRSMRNNIVMKGISEENNETPSQTKDIVSNIIGRHLNIDSNTVHNAIERAHRGGKRDGNKKPRNIYIYKTLQHRRC